MKDKTHLFRQVTCNDMVRKVAQTTHQPLRNDERIDALLARLAEAEKVLESELPPQPTTE